MEYLNIAGYLLTGALVTHPLTCGSIEMNLSMENHHMQRFPTVRLTDFLFPSQSLWTVPAEESEMDDGTNLICICSTTVSRGQKGLSALYLQSL